MRALLVLIVSSVAFAACDSTGVVVAPGTNMPGVVVIGSNPTTNAQSDLRFVVNATTQSLNLNSFTVHLLSGENAGGPMVTYPQANLTSLFGSTVIVRGGTRTFLFHPPFVCTTVQPCKILADATFTDGSGQQHATSTAATIP